MTSKKKKDRMLAYTNITSASLSGSSAYNIQPAVFSGFLPGTNPAQYPMLWCATARDSTVGASGQATVSDDASRTSQTCFMRGISEKIEIQVADGVPWQWRRICFTYRNLTTIVPNNTTNGTAFLSYARDTNTGYVRTMNLIPTAAQVDAFEGILFRGSKTRDWIDPMIAQVDPLRVDVKYDKTITIASGNEDGVIRKYSRWHGMNKNLTYADDEFGNEMVEAFHSVSDKRGMGDYYICDYFTPRKGAQTSNQLSVNMSATLYWHEK